MNAYLLGGIVAKSKSVEVYHTLKYMELGNISSFLNLDAGVYVYQSGYAGMDFQKNEPLLGYVIVYVKE